MFKPQHLSLIEQRVIGCLLEKQVTTPDQYPLTLNSLTLACNQKSSRDPVMDLSESEVLDAVTKLIKSGEVSEAPSAGNRVSKYQQRFCNTEFGELKLNEGERAILCVLFLRGPQTPGELRTRTQRMHEFGLVDQVEEALIAMAAKDEPWVVQLAREPGKREARWQHCFGEVFANSSSNAANTATLSNPTATPALQELIERIELLELQVEELSAEIDQLKNQN